MVKGKKSGDHRQRFHSNSGRSSDRLDDAYLVDVESTYSAAFAVLEFVADEMRRWAVFVTLGDGDRVFVGAAILPSVGDAVAWYAVYFVQYLFSCHHNFFCVWVLPNR